MPDIEGVDLQVKFFETEIITPSRGTRQELLTLAPKRYRAQ